jgi:hypothetical protein
MGFIAFRTNAKKDADIEKDLARFSNMTQRLKEAYRIAMAVERGEYIKAGLAVAITTGGMPSMVTKPPAELPKPLLAKEVEVDIKANMLGGF